MIFRVLIIIIRCDLELYIFIFLKRFGLSMCKIRVSLSFDWISLYFGFFFREGDCDSLYTTYSRSCLLHIFFLNKACKSPPHMRVPAVFLSLYLFIDSYMRCFISCYRCIFCIYKFLDHVNYMYTPATSICCCKQAH